MGDTPTIKWPGKSGTEYTYYIHDIDTTFEAVPANYIFAKVVSGYWEPVYIGETSDLSDRMSNHEKEKCARRNGATHIHAHKSSSDRKVRLAEETDLRQRWTTPCNDQ